MVKELLIFAGGVIVGGVISWYVTKCKYEELNAKDRADMEEYYIGKHPEKEPRETVINVHHINEEYVKPKKVDYTTYYTPDKDPAESEHPEEDDGDTGEFITNDYKEGKLKPPKIIKASEYGDIEGFSQMSLLYYQESETLTINEDADSEDIIYFDEIEDFIGDALTKFGFSTNDEERIYVRNFARGCDFEITKVFGPFEG